jgi:hypothetical protein
MIAACRFVLLQTHATAPASLWSHSLQPNEGTGAVKPQLVPMGRRNWQPGASSSADARCRWAHRPCVSSKL